MFSSLLQLLLVECVKIPTTPAQEQINVVIRQDHRIKMGMHRGPWRAKGHRIRLSFDLAIKRPIKNARAAWRDGLGANQQRSSAGDLGVGETDKN